jgi:O-antigen/teichoic acid export membrane protein
LTASSSGRIAGLFGHSAVYAGANVLQRGLSFMLIPIYAKFFTTAEFGAMDILYQMVLIMAIAACLGLPQGLVRGFFPPNGIPASEEERKSQLGALATLLVPLTAVWALAAHVLADPLSRILFHGEGKADWVRLAAWLFLATTLNHLPLQLLKTIGRPAAYAGWSIACFVLSAGGNLYFVVTRTLGVEGMLLGNVFGFGVTAVGMWLTLMGGIRPNFRWVWLRPMFVMGLPMVPSMLCRKVLETSSRFILPVTWGLSEVGIFSMGARLSSVLDILVLTPFLYAWQPFFYRQGSAPDAPQLFSRVTHYILIGLAGLLVLLQCVQGQILQFIGHGKFAGANPVATWLAIGVAFNGMQYCVSVGLHLRGKLVAEMGIMAFSAAVSLGLNFLLASRWGAAGAAASTAAGYAIYLVASAWLANRVYPVPYLWGRGAWIFLTALAAGWAVSQSQGAWAKSSVLAAFLVFGIGTDLWKHGEIAAILRRLQRARSGPAREEIPQATVSP